MRVDACLQCRNDRSRCECGRFLYVESGGSGAFDAYAVNANGSLSPIETVWNIPLGNKGIAVS